MSHLSRARSTEAKEARRSAILRAARELYERESYQAITMAAVARRAKLAKGTVFLYFQTKETLFLDLLDELLDEWLGAVHDVVAQGTRPGTSAAFAGLLTDSLGERPLLARLLPLGGCVLEPNVDAGHRAEHLHRSMRRRFRTGALVEQRLGLARRGDGVQLLQFADALIIGLSHGGDEPGDSGEGPGPDPRTTSPTRDADLRTALTVLFNGFHRKDA